MWQKEVIRSRYFKHALKKDILASFPFDIVIWIFISTCVFDVVPDLSLMFDAQRGDTVESGRARHCYFAYSSSCETEISFGVFRSVGGPRTGICPCIRFKRAMQELFSELYHSKCRDSYAFYEAFSVNSLCFASFFVRILFSL